ncbi:MAG: AI-2E family transporter [Armatimonadetes bacterium]|nr:AI-2E family transporter [Armatimonadota bacterium]
MAPLLVGDDNTAWRTARHANLTATRPASMGKDPTSRILILLTSLGLVAWVLAVAWEAILPFVIAFALAAVLDPLIDRLQRLRLPRWVAVALAFGCFLGLSAAVGGILVPRALVQTKALSANLGGYLDRTLDSLDAWAQANAGLLRSLRLPVSLSDALNQYRENIAAAGQGVVQGVLGMFGATASRLMWVVLIPVLTLYALVDYDLFRARVLYLVPPDHRQTVADLFGQVGRVFVSYLRGLLIVCSCVGLATGLLLGVFFHLPYALVIAVLAAILYAIPYIGAWTVLATVVLVAWMTGHHLGYILWVFFAELLVLQVFDQVITPRVVGGRVGIHPVTGLFALTVGGWLFGLPGMVLAVPIAASLKVVAGHFYPRLVEPMPEGAPREYAERGFLPRRPRKRPPDPDGGAGGNT